MASFGSFETERELFSDHAFTVYSAKRSGDPKTEYAVKVFALERSGFDTEITGELAPLMGDIERTAIERIALQQKAAAASKNIAPVYETGQDERGVWYATAFYARSVNRIISGRVALNPEALRHIVQSIAQGALDFKRTCGRSHGDIRPTNVQISRSEKLTDADVVLSDPLPSGDGDVERYELSDLRAVGRTILQLVKQREISNEEDFLILPILSGPEWTRLFGKDTEGWLALCNRLLDPNLSLDQITLEKLVGTLEGFRQKSGISPKLLIAAAAVVVVLGVGGFFALRPTSQTIEVTSDPPGAAILVDKAAMGKAPVKLKLKKGSYAIEARHSELRLLEQTTNLVVQSGSPGALNFRFAYGSVAIFSKPPGVTIKRDGVKVGETPADGKPFIVPIVAAGVEVKYQLSLDQYVEREARGIVTNGQQLELREALPKSSEVGTLEVESTPRGAKVFDGDKLLITTPDKTRLEARSYLLKVVYSDWPPLRTNVIVTKGAETSIKVYFPSGRISLDSQPSEATVFLGTNNLGTAPLITPPLPVGPVTFRFERAGFEATNLTTEVRDRATLPLKATLISTNGTFELTSDPVESTILDAAGKELGRTAAGKPVFYTGRPGSYQFTARTPGLEDRTEMLTVGKSAVLKHTFQFDYGRVQMVTVPPGAAISIDGRSLGATPATFIQKPGQKFTYRIVAPDYLPTNADVVVASRDNRTFPVKLSPEPVAVSLTSDPDGAQFYTADGSVSATRTISTLPWGTNVVVARHPLYAALAPVTNDFVVRKGAANVMKIKFKYGTVVLDTEPPDATADVFAEGKAIARTPATIYVPPGRVDYQVIYENQTNRVGVNVAEDKQYAFKSTFEVKRDYTNSIGMILVRARDVYVGMFEVSHKEYLALMPKGDGMDGQMNEPITNVKWADAVEFCKRLTAKDADSLKAKRLAGYSYALPTEVEWTRAAGSDTNQLAEAVFSYMSNTKPMKIDPARKSFNDQRVYDLFGNVSEWCVGSNNEPLAIGGNFLSLFSRKTEANWLAMVKNVQRMTGAPVTEAISAGSPVIGFRCVLRPSP